MRGVHQAGSHACRSLEGMPKVIAAALHCSVTDHHQITVGTVRRTERTQRLSLPLLLLAAHSPIFRNHRRRSADCHANFYAPDLPGSNGRLVKAPVPQVATPLFRTHFDDSQRAADTLTLPENCYARPSLPKRPDP